MVKKFKICGVSYELLRRVGYHVELSIRVHSKTRVFWFNTKTRRKMTRVGRWFRPGRGNVPGQARWKPSVKIAPCAPIPPAQTQAPAPPASKLESVVREMYESRYGSANVQSVAFFVLGERLGMSPEFLGGLAVAEGVTVPSFLEETPAPEAAPN